MAAGGEDLDTDAFADLSDHETASTQYTTDAGAVLSSDLKLPKNLRIDSPPLDDGLESVFQQLSDHETASTQQTTDAGGMLDSDLKLPSNLRIDGPPLDDGFESAFQQLFERLRVDPDGVRQDEQSFSQSGHAPKAQRRSAEQLFDLLDIALRTADEDTSNAAARARLRQSPPVSDMSAESPSSSASADAAHISSGTKEARAAMAALDEFEHRLGLPLAEFGALGAGGAPDPGGTDTTAAAIAVADAAAEAAVTLQSQRRNRGGATDDGDGVGSGRGGDNGRDRMRSESGGGGGGGGSGNIGDAIFGGDVH